MPLVVASNSRNASAFPSLRRAATLSAAAAAATSPFLCFDRNAAASSSWLRAIKKGPKLSPRGPASTTDSSRRAASRCSRAFSEVASDERISSRAARRACFLMVFLMVF